MVRSLGIVRAAMFLFAATRGDAAVESTRSYVDASLPPRAVRTPLNSTERTKHSCLSEQAQVVQPTSFLASWEQASWEKVSWEQVSWEQVQVPAAANLSVFSMCPLALNGFHFVLSSPVGLAAPHLVARHCPHGPRWFLAVLAMLCRCVSTIACFSNTFAPFRGVSGVHGARQALQRAPTPRHVSAWKVVDPNLLMGGDGGALLVGGGTAPLVTALRR